MSAGTVSFRDSIRNPLVLASMGQKPVAVEEEELDEDEEEEDDDLEDDWDEDDEEDWYEDEDDEYWEDDEEEDD